MEIVNSNVATLSNFEVMSHLQKIKDTQRKQKGQLATITYETLRFLENSPCSKLNSSNVIDCIKALDAFNLKKREKLMIVNNPPATPLEIQLLVEESEERLSEDQVQLILNICVKYLGVTLKEAEPEEEEEEN
ncbi:DNA-directed RNA polymerase III subunit RPC9 [Onthophagus taurus]|uniref:DNA-directed RNA polymerase III subunit RPC9 n=1 Tax=Onthophagus taurus TaxID=166361 RepID=UPI000C205EBA|nr:DNA-directed RNA polymerase III subunit RPC9 [Onthophagus taurus]